MQTGGAVFTSLHTDTRTPRFQLKCNGAFHSHINTREICIEKQRCDIHRYGMVWVWYHLSTNNNNSMLIDVCVHVVIIKYYNGINSKALCILNVAEMAIWTRCRCCSGYFTGRIVQLCIGTCNDIYTRTTHIHTRTANADRLSPIRTLCIKYYNSIKSIIPIRRKYVKEKGREKEICMILQSCYRHTHTFSFVHSINRCNWIYYQIVAAKKKTETLIEFSWQQKQHELLEYWTTPWTRAESVSYYRIVFECSAMDTDDLRLL